MIVSDSAIELLAQAPLAIAPKFLGYMLSVLQGRSAPVAPRMPFLRGRRLDGTALVDGIAVVPVVGPIMQRPDVFNIFGAVSVHDIRATVGAAIEDPSVEAVLLVVDSPGGEVAGVADLADALFAVRGRKPMLAVADEGIFSAAYWIASAIGPIALPRTGGVGSIGTLAVHTDVSGALERMGVKMTIVKSGAKKAMLSPFTPLSPAGHEMIQAEVDRLAGMFFDAVARHRHGLSAEAIAGFEGGTFEGPAAVDAGLADAVETVDGAFLAMKMHLLTLGDREPDRPRAAVLDIGVRRERTDAMSDLKDQLRAAADGTPPTLPAPPPEPETVNAPQAPRTPWAGLTNVVNIEEARKAARLQAQQEERDRNTQIMHWCAFAQKADLAESYMASEMTVEQVRNDLASQTAMMFGPEVNTNRPPGVTFQRQFDSVEQIYARRKASIEDAKRNRRWL